MISNPPGDLGVLRRLSACADRSGFFTVLAIDHPAAFILPPTTTSRNDQLDAIKVKAELAEAMAAHASAVLVDPDSGLPACVATGLLPGNVGLILCIEGDDYQRQPDARRVPDVRAGWTVAQLARAGGDACKLLWRYRHEVPEAAAQRQFVLQLAEQCAEVSLPFIVEPIWVPLKGEDVADVKVATTRTRGIVEYARLARDLGADLVKTEFPGRVDTEASREEALKACAELDASLDVPWLLLSAGVTFETFRAQTEIAARAGASGFIGGRAIWDSVVTNDPEARRAGLQTATQRLAELTSIVYEHGRPWRFSQRVEDLAASYPLAWYAH